MKAACNPALQPVRGLVSGVSIQMLLTPNLVYDIRRRHVVNAASGRYFERADTPYGNSFDYKVLSDKEGRWHLMQGLVLLCMTKNSFLAKKYR